MKETGWPMQRKDAALSSDPFDGISPILPEVYDQLKAVAENTLRRERGGHTLQTTALVHEAYLRLARQKKAEWVNREQFLATAAQMIRRVLIDYARTRDRQRRGGGRPQVTLTDEDCSFSDDSLIDLMDLDEALRKLTETAPEKAQLVELRFFGGLSCAEAADALDVSIRTATDWWSFARAWLRRELSKGEKA